MSIGEGYRKSIVLIVADILFIFPGIKSDFLHRGQEGRGK